MPAASGFSSPTPDDRVMTINCLYCGKPLEVARKTLSVTCKFCHKPLSLQDVPINRYHSRRSTDTMGVITVEKKGHVVGDMRCGGAIVRGRVQGDIVSRGPVLVGPEAEIKGDVTAPTLAVGPGAILEGHYEIGKAEPQQPPEENGQ